MRKRITKEGNSHKIRITKEDMNLHGFETDDIIEFTITKVIKQEKGDEHG